MEGVGIVLIRLADEVELEVGETRVVAFEQSEIDGDALLHHAVFEVIGDALAVARVGDALAERREVVLVAGPLDVGAELAACAHEVQAPAQETPRRAHAGWVDVRLRQHAAAEQRRKALQLSGAQRVRFDA